jgi:hypothetical protein
MAESNHPLYSHFSHSEYSVPELIHVFQQCSEKINILHQHSSEDFRALNVAIRNHYKQVSAIHQTVSQIAAGLNPDNILLPKETADSLAYISNIITNLQFDDIIRQKLEHIQQTIHDIINELDAIQQKSYNPDSQPLKYLSILSEITKLHAAQLNQTNQDYQKAFAGIKADLEGVQQNSIVIAKTINTLLIQQYSADLKEKLAYINMLSDQLSAQINCSLLEIKYCASFALEVKEINIHMQTVFSGWMEGIKSHTETEVLLQLQKLYTMESERAVHHKVLNIKEDIDNIQDCNSEAADDNLELF